MLTHGNLLANLVQVNRQIPVVNPEYRFLSLLPLSHMFEQMGGFFTPFFHGSCIVYLGTPKTSAIIEAIAEEDISAVVAVPRLLQLLRGSIEQGLAAKHPAPLFHRLMAIAQTHPSGMKKDLFSTIRRRFGRHFTLFVSGGVPLSVELFRFWATLGFTVVKGYGLTECSPVLTANTWERLMPGSVVTPLPGVDIRMAEGEFLAQG
jgi:long-chain acyl-CoA synthetase